MEIAANTKISAVIKENPAAIEAIISINRHFEKLRNPVLRKILASRVTIAQAARIGGCQVEAFYEKLAPLGFEAKAQPLVVEKETAPGASALPTHLQNLPPDAFHQLDVREAIATGHDPFQQILEAVNRLMDQDALVLVNTFEPTPLLKILEKRGFDSFSEEKATDLVHTYFWRRKGIEEVVSLPNPHTIQDFERLRAHYADYLRQVDVRSLEMPLPMVTILNELESLPAGHALHVTHKRIPQFLLPRLQDRGFLVAIQEKSPTHVCLLIYKPQ